MKFVIIAAAFSITTAAHADIYAHRQDGGDTRVWVMPSAPQQSNDYRQFMPSAQYNQPPQQQYQSQPCRFVNGLMTCQ